MEIKAKLAELRDRARDWLQSQVWYNQIREKWEELDAETQRAVKVGGSVLGALAFVLLTASLVWSARSLKQELSDKRDLLAALQSANDEMRRLRDANAGALAQGEAGNWQGYTEALAATVGVDKEALTVSGERALDGDVPSDIAKTTAFDISLKQVNIRQIVKFAHALETGTRPARLKMLTIDTNPDGSGYLSAQLVVTGYQVGGTK